MVEWDGDEEVVRTDSLISLMPRPGRTFSMLAMNIIDSKSSFYHSYQLIEHAAMFLSLDVVSTLRGTQAK